MKTITSMVFVFLSITLSFSQITQEITQQQANQTTEQAIIATQKNIDKTDKGFKELKELYDSLHSQMEILKNENKKIKDDLTSSRAENIGRQRKLYENNYELILGAFNDIQKVKRQIAQLDKLLKVTIVGTLASGLNNPTNNDLGNSFQAVVKKSCENLLIKDMNTSSKKAFLDVINRITNTPVLATLLNTNPIGTLTHNILMKAVDKKEKEIKQTTINDFLNDIRPYTDFYNELDVVSSEFRDELKTFQGDLKKFESKYTIYSKSISKELENQDPLQKIDLIFKRTEKDNLKLDDYITINNLKPVTNIVALINQSSVNSEGIDEKPFDQAFNNYVDKLISLLDKAKSSQSLKFKKENIEKMIREFEKNKISE